MKPRTPVLIYILVMIALTSMTFEIFTDDSGYFYSPLFWGLILIAIILLLIMNTIEDIIENQSFLQLSEEEKVKYIQEKSIPYFQRIWNSAFKKQSIVEEKSILIDHGFDGITELDNQLPKWWLGLFWFGWIFCFAYMLAFTFTDYAHPDAEYNDETKKMLASIKEYEKNAPQINIETAKYNADNIGEGEELFKTNCVTCHGDNGKGGIGPNLTDNSWINIKQKNLFKNIFWMLENGSPNNPTMRPFLKDGTISGRDAEKIAAYVYHINQEKAPISPSEGGAVPQGNETHWSE